MMPVMVKKKVVLLTLLGLLLAGTSWAENLPKLIDLGADKCIPCIKMAPILEKLKGDFAGQMDVEFIDVWKRKEDAAKYGVRMIPTQIFFDADGQELYRHQGFIGHEDILVQWQKLGYEFNAR